MLTLVRPILDKFGRPNKTGQKYADWLNSLGPDSSHYVGKTTIGKVRKNYLRRPEITHIEIAN